MKLSVTSWSFPLCSLNEAINISKALDIHAIDLGYLHSPSLNRDDVLNKPNESAERILKQNINIPCFYHLFGNDTKQRNLSLKDQYERNKAQIESIALFCAEASIETLFLLPGVVNPGQNVQKALSTSAENLKRMIEVCEKRGVSLAIEPHIGSYIESPELTLNLLDMVPGLKLVLDYAHFVCLGYTQNNIDRLLPFTKHMHLRQAKPGSLQTKMENGTINFQTIFSKLAENSYDGYLAIEFVHQNYMNTLYEDVLSETIKMRNLVREWDGESM